MRVPAVLVLAVVFAGYLQEPATPETPVEAVRERLPDFFPRALRLAETWNEEALPARVEGGGFATPPPDVPQTKVKRSALRGHAGGAETYVFADPLSGDLLVVDVAAASPNLVEVPAAPDAPVDDLLGALRPLLDGASASAAPVPASPRVQVDVDASAPCRGWWVCLLVHVEAWWAG